jgi:sugar fermentation stimulation protein A
LVLYYTRVKRAIFLQRPNRFIAHVLVDGKEELVHVKNTGRCKEILTEGSEVILEEATNQARKTKYSLIAAYKGEVLINIDSQIPNAVVYDAVVNNLIPELSCVTKLSREVVFGNSRFDMYYEAKGQRGFIEVKGVTLETDGLAMFPDAPTERGTKHIYEMIKAVGEGYGGYIFFLIQMKGVNAFTPNSLRDPRLAMALKEAREKGVTILVYDSIVTENHILLGSPVKLLL